MNLEKLTSYTIIGLAMWVYGFAAVIAITFVYSILAEYINWKIVFIAVAFGVVCTLTGYIAEKIGLDNKLIKWLRGSGDVE